MTDTFGVRTLLRPIGDPALPPPYFSMWQPSNLRRSGDVNEEVPREGLHLTRRRTLARWTDGSTWLWTSFQADVGVGEGSSGLRFDGLIEKTAEG